MNGLKNKILNTKMVFFVGFLIFCCIACNSKVGKKEATSIGLLNSKTYHLYLNYYENKTKIQNYDIGFFNLIGEEGFLFAEKYKIYAVYLYSSSSDTGSNNLKIYTLKFKDNMGIASFKEIAKMNYPFDTKKQDTKEAFFKMKVLSRIVDISYIKKFKEEIPLKDIKERPPENFNSDYRFLFYYDGNNYYRLSNQQVDEKTLNEIDSLFRKSSIFKE